MVPQFGRSSDFVIDKPARTPCRNLLADSRCGVHTELRSIGFRGCTVYDCFGAGQHLSQGTFGGRDWRDDPEIARQMFDAFPVMRGLHELLYHLRECLDRDMARAVHAEADRLAEKIAALAESAPKVLASVDLDVLFGQARGPLIRCSDLVRAPYRNAAAHPGADLAGADLTGKDLRGALLRNATLIGADLTGSDLTDADLLGADMRAAKVHRADLSGAMFLSQIQVNAAAGDAETRLPTRLMRPAHWG